MKDIPNRPNKLNENVVSIIVPTYMRGDAYLSRCIDSLLCQTHENVEIVIVDDNEYDSVHSVKTQKVIAKFDNEKIKYIKTKVNSGAALSRNEGIFASTGDYITFLDDDDVYLPEKIFSQLEYMVDNNLEMTFTDLGLYNEDDKLVDYRSHDYVNSLKNEDLIKLHVVHNLTGTPTYMFKASSIKDIGGFDNHPMSEEYYLMEKAINSGLKIGYIDKSYVKAYRHGQGGESFSDRKIEGEKKLYASKQKYFHLLNKSQIRFTRCRYYAVLAVSALRRKKYGLFIKYAAASFLGAPFIVLKEAIKYKRNTKIHQ